MAGAFVAVADDATATWWNPAGLATGALFDVDILRQNTWRPRDVDTAARSGLPAEQDTLTGFAAAYPALGLSYYRFRIRQETPSSSTDTTATGRQQGGLAGVSFQALNLAQYGVTMGQSVGPYLVLATTLKLMRADMASEDVAADQASFGQVKSLQGDKTESHAGLDLGVMAHAGPVRLGLTVKNLHAVTFGEGATAQTLAREVRAGAAVTTRRDGLWNGFTVAGDWDLTRAATVFGQERRIAIGGETWLLQRHLGVRGGWSTDISGESPNTLSGGLSVTVWTGTYLEGFVASGADSGLKSWGTDLRLTY